MKSFLFTLLGGDRYLVLNNIMVGPKLEKDKIRRYKQQQLAAEKQAMISEPSPMVNAPQKIKRVRARISHAPFSLLDMPAPYA